MTDTERKEVEIEEYAKQLYLSEDDNRVDSDWPVQGSHQMYYRLQARRLTHLGYTKRPQDNMIDRQDAKIAESHAYFQGIEDAKANFSKDNSGMVPILKNEQLISDPVNGDCFRACVTSLLGILNSEIIPSCGDGSWFVEYLKFLGKFGLNIHYEEKACWRNGYWIASVPSLNFPKVTHAIIMNCQEVYFDPSPNKKYTEGENLLGKDVVLGGWYFEVEDFSKLRFSQQPPKERKVSLEEIRQTIRQHGGWESSIDDISKAILSLLNAKESTEKE